MVNGQNPLGDSVERLMADLRSAGPGAPGSPGAAGAVDEASQLLAQALQTGQAFRRAVPVTTSLIPGAAPPWAGGLQSSGSLGPFKDLANRDVWIDLFPIVEQVSLVRVAGGVPFLTLPIEIFIHLPGPPSPTVTYDVPAGSVWFASQLLDATAPAGSWTGIQVSGGTVNFSGAVTGTGNEIVVPSGVTVDLNVNTASQPPGTGTGPGQDSRDAIADMPASFRLSVGATAQLTLDPAEVARLSAFGFGTNLTPAAGPVAYNPALNVLAVPLTAQTSPFTVGSVKATAFSLAGAAPITAAAWALPVAVIDPASLGAASGAGSIMLGLGPGLTGTWLGQATAVPLMQALLVADPASLTVLTADAEGDLVLQQPALPGTEPGRLDLRWMTTFPIIFVSEAAGVEGVATQAKLSAVFDRPVDLRGERLSLQAPAIPVLFTATAQGTFLLIDGQLQPLSQSPIAFALVNAVLRAAPPASIVLYGGFDGTTLNPAVVLLGYQLLALVPTLPDPYAASYGSILTAVDQQGGDLVSILTWQATTSGFDFRILQGVDVFVLSRSRSDPFQAEQAPTALMALGGTNLWPQATQAAGGALVFERSDSLILLDVSTNAGQFGVAWRPTERTTDTFAVENLAFVAEGADVLLVTLPAVQWEAVETISDPGPDPLPQWVDFNNSGVPTVFSVPTTNLVPVYPTAAITNLVDNFAQREPLTTQARFTLPFGIIALASLHGAVPGGDSRSTTVVLNQPTGGSLQGSLQLRIDAHDAALSSDQSASFDGYTTQLPVAQPGNRSVLGDDVTTTFNSYLGAGGGRPMVPVTRIDVSGYGESLFSDWRNPYPDPVAVSQARFDVMVGRTAFEVVQVRSILFPYGVEVVRTITIERRNNAIITRTDSGWKAVSDGIYQFPGSNIVTHPGVVTRITDVVNINDTGQVITVTGGVDMAAVYFDGDLVLDGAPANPDGSPRLVPAKGQFGFIQITALSGGALINALQYSDLLSQAGLLGGPLDTDINVGSGTQLMHLQQVSVGVTQGMGGPEFVMAVWGAPAFPGGGQWSVVEIDDPTAAPTALAQDSGVPLIRAGAAGTPPSPSSPYRFADPADLNQPANPGRDYAVLHAMGTQRALYPRPKIEATDPTQITSTQLGTIADPYSLGTALGPYPTPDKTVPFPTAAWALVVSADGNYKLNLPSPFAAGVGRRTLDQAGSVRGDVDYTAAQVTYTVDTSQAVGWQFRVDDIVKIMNTTSLGDIIQLGANIVSSAGATTQFEQPSLLLGGALSIVQDILTMLADLGITGVLTVLMTNSWALKAAGIVPVVDATGHALQIPPYPDPSPDFKLDDTEIKVEWDVAPTADAAAFSMGGQPMFAIHVIPNVYVTAIIKFQVQVSTANGTDYSLLIGVGLAFSLDADPFSFKGLFAITFAGVWGDAVLGYAIGFLLQLQASIEPIISVTLSLEGQLALVKACEGTPSETKYGAARLILAVEVSVCLVFSINFQLQTTASKVMEGPDGSVCPLPNVLPNAS
jgi:type 1 fimbria pilin